MMFVKTCIITGSSVSNRLPLLKKQMFCHFHDEKRKLADTQKMKKIRSFSQSDLITFLNRLDEALITKIMSASQVIDAVVNDGRNDQIVKWVQEHA